MIEGEPYEVINNVPFTVCGTIENAKLMLINTKAEWDAFYKWLMEQKIVACDTETSGFRYFENDRIVGMSFGWGDWQFYIPVRHEEFEMPGEQPPQLSMEDIREDLQSFFSQKDVFTVWHNSRFDKLFYSVDDIEIRNQVHDTLLLWKLFDENAPGKLKMIASGWTDELGRKRKGLVGDKADAKEKEVNKWRGNEASLRRQLYSQEVMDKADELEKSIEHQDKNRNQLKTWIRRNLLAGHKYAKATKDQVHYGFVPIPLMVEYAATDTYLTYKLYNYVKSNMKFTNKLVDLYINELKLSQCLFDAEKEGMLIDDKHLQTLGKTLEEEIVELDEKIRKELGFLDINLGSPQQLAKAFQSYGIPLTKKTKAGQYALDQKVLNKLEKDYDVVKDILHLRGLTKLKTQYVDGILEKLTADNILHCSFNQNVSTGRMSSSSPNLQNIPRGDTRIRRAFVVPEGYVYVLIDYSQVEVRLTAHFSEDPVLLKAYNTGQDVHTRTMCAMFGYDYDYAIEVLSNPDHPEYKTLETYRSISKRINFGVIYGVSGMSLSEQIPRPKQYEDLDEEAWVKQCDEFIERYFAKYVDVKRFIQRTERYVRKHSQIENYYGRIRRLPHAQADRILGREEGWRVGRAKRQGVNFLVQGTAADVFKIAAVRVHDILKGKKSKLVNFVHDEVQLYMSKDELYLLDDIKKTMEDFNFKVPLEVDVSYSMTSWADKKDLK